MSTRNKIVYVIALLTLGVGAYFLYMHSSPALAKCPDAYGTDDAGSTAYLAATNKWTNDFFDAHPDATMTDWSEARHQFWVDNHCTAALQGYEDTKNGKADPVAMERIQKIIDETMASSTSKDVYLWSQEDRDSFFYYANEEKEYQAVVNATDDGIKNHKDLIWDDVDFWNHRGVALYGLGICNDSFAAFYHASMRDPENEIANGFMGAIANKHCGTATSTNSQN